jgi:hypothetical protein
MSVSARRFTGSVAESAVVERGLSIVLAVALLTAGTAHVWVATEHGMSAFAVMALAAGLAQVGLAIVSRFRSFEALYRWSVVLSLVLIELYLFNVTVGLPPLIAHTHTAGTHSVLGVTLAMPNAVEPDGLLVQAAQIVTVLAATFLGRSTRPADSF